jgi:hypothetical protein
MFLRFGAHDRLLLLLPPLYFHREGKGRVEDFRHSRLTAATVELRRAPIDRRYHYGTLHHPQASSTHNLSSKLVSIDKELKVCALHVRVNGQRVNPCSWPGRVPKTVELLHRASPPALAPGQPYGLPFTRNLLHEQGAPSPSHISCKDGIVGMTLVPRPRRAIYQSQSNNVRVRDDALQVKRILPCHFHTWEDFLLPNYRSVRQVR